MNTFFQVSEEDVFNVLEAHCVVEDLDDQIVSAAFKSLDIDQVVEATHWGNTFEEQTRYAHRAIEKQFIESGQLSPDSPTLF